MISSSNITTKATALSSLKPLSVSDCPIRIQIYFNSSFGDQFVIDLVKNTRLISDRYFEITRNGQDQLGQSINSFSNKHNDDSTLLPKQKDVFVDDFYKGHKFIQLHNYISNNDHCHYQGLVNDELNFISAISIVEKRLLSGYMHHETGTFYLHADTTSSKTVLEKITDICQTKRNAPSSLSTRNSEMINLSFEGKSNNARVRILRDTTQGNKAKRFTNSNPDNKVLHEPFQSNSNSLCVELLVVHDHKQYSDYGGNPSIIAERTMQIVNIMNAFYRQLNIFVALVGVVLWTEKDEIKLTDDGDATLTSFLKYRCDKLLPRYHHDNAQLITSTSFNGSVVGKALKGPICTHDHSGGVNTDHSHSPAIVAVTLAHELGHNLGMEHDEEDKCKCPDEKCIMSSSSSTVHPKHWSSCSVEYLEESRKHGLLDCLTNMPDRVFGPVCGNGLVEEGEDCDIGEPIPYYGTSRSRNKMASKCVRGHDCPTDPRGLLVNPCCDRQTCKFVANATCAQGPCCDLTRCSVFNSTETRICRPRKTVCDFEEVCDGQSEYCPPDVYYHDGIECKPTTSIDGQSPGVETASYNRSRAYCYQGRCASHESQCQLLWGSSASTSKEICYEQNVHGNTSANCGYDRIEKQYLDCEPEDTLCGMLHCVHDQPSSGDMRKTGKLGYGFESASILTVSFFVMSNQAKIFCHGAIVDAGPGIRDPGLVPNGAACGEDKMCLNQKCVPIYDVISKSWCPSDCNGNGICDNLGVCHCNDGTIGTSCYQFFGSNFHLSLILYVIMFFGPIVALIVLAINGYRKQIKIWWFLHNRRMALKNKAQSQQKRVKYGPENHNISISEPIPLNRQDNVNRPFYQPSEVDPWAETGCDMTGPGVKSPGYRLEPLKRDIDRADFMELPVVIGSNASHSDGQNSMKPSE